MMLLICVDRDADLEVKTGIKGPVVGRENVLDAAVKLALADPRDSDANALFEGIRVYDELKKKGKDVEICVLTGSRNVGIESDERIAKQLEFVLKDVDAKEAILISDGASDEYILPIIQSRIKVNHVDRVVVRQHEKIESTVYLILEFLKEVAHEPKLARLFFGLPGLAAIIYAIFKDAGWRLIIGVVGTFLLIKGFNLESTIQKFVDELKSSFFAGRLSFFTYVTAIILAVAGVVKGYLSLEIVEGQSLQSYVPAFISSSIDLFMFSAIIALFGKIIDSALEKKSFGKYVVAIIFVIAVRLILDSISLFILGSISTGDLIVSIALGLTLTLFSLLSIRSLRGASSEAEVEA